MPIFVKEIVQTAQALNSDDILTLIVLWVLGGLFLGGLIGLLEVLRNRRGDK